MKYSSGSITQKFPVLFLFVYLFLSCFISFSQALKLEVAGKNCGESCEFLWRGKVAQNLNKKNVILFPPYPPLVHTLRRQGYPAQFNQPLRRGKYRPKENTLCS